MSSPDQLLFIYQHRSAFVEDDERLLAEAYRVHTLAFGAPKSPTKLLRSWSRQLFWLLRKLPRARFVFGWFADYHMVLPVALARMWRVPVVVVIGGSDAQAIPALHYGVYSSRWRAPLGRFVVRNASLLLPVTASLIEGQNPFAAWPDVLPTGLRAYVPDLKTPFRVIPTGYDPDQWPMGPLSRPASVLSVGLISNLRTALIKGIDLLIEAARLLPDIPVHVVGVSPAVAAEIRARWHPPNNLHLDPPRRREELSALYGQTAVYAQLSRSEGLPNVVCEAMLCGCAPVGSPVGGMPEVIEGLGQLVFRPDPREIARAIRQCLQSEGDRRLAFRERIKSRYSLAQRKRALLETLESLRARPHP